MFSCSLAHAKGKSVAVSDKDLPKPPAAAPQDAPVKKKSGKKKPQLRSKKNSRNETMPDRTQNLNELHRFSPEGKKAAKDDPNNPDRVGSKTNLNKLPKSIDDIDYESGDDPKYQQKDLNKRKKYRVKGEDAKSLGGPDQNLNREVDNPPEQDNDRDDVNLNKIQNVKEKGEEAPGLGGPETDLNKFDTPQQGVEREVEKKPTLNSKKKRKKQQGWDQREKPPLSTPPPKPSIPSKKGAAPSKNTPTQIKATRTQNYQYEKGIIIKQTKGLVLFHDKADMNLVNTSNLEGFHVVNMKLPGKGKNLEEILTPIYLNKPLTRQVIDKLCIEIENYFKQHDHPIVKVVVPRQAISHGVLSLLLVEGKLGKVSSKGNIWLSDARLQSYVKLQPNEVIDERLVRESVEFINRNPFRTVEAVYQEGETYQTTDLELLVKERTPFRIYSGADNMGLSAINRTRFFIGFNYGNLFGLDQILSYQLTVSKDLTSYHSHTFSYTIPFPWQNVLELYGGLSSVRADMPLPFDRSKGRSMQASARYTVPLSMYWKELTHEFRFGFDFKRTDNTLEFVENYPVFGETVNLSQVVVGYSGAITTAHSKTSLEIDGYWSPGEIFQDQSNADYETLRDGAKNHWIYGRGEFKQSFMFGKSGEILLRAAAQWSSMTLIPSEEFGIGGLETVRGYEERTLNGDNAFFGSIEAKTPAWNGFIKPRYARDGILVEDLWQLVLFCDYGAAWLKNDHFNLTGQNDFVEEPKSQFLLGAGPGLRYQVGSYFMARLDAGIKVHRDPEMWGGGRIMVHFMAMASY